MKKRKFTISRTLRFAAALAIFTAAAAMFIGGGIGACVPAKWQFGPALSGTLSAVAAGGLAGCTGMLAVILTVSALTLVFGRWYCALWCPLGILQNGILALRRWIVRNHFPFRYHPGYRWWRAGIFLTVSGLLLGGVALPFALLEPFTNFGKAALGAGRPALVEIHNLLFPDEPWFLNPIWPGLLGAGLTVSALLTILTLWRGRLFCNLLCPVGVVLHWVGKYSWFAYRIDPDRCVHCGRCTRYCPGECVNPEGDGIDSGRCVVCGKCAEVCPVGAIAYHRPVRTPAPAVDPDRRRLLAAAALLPLGAAGGAMLAPLRRRETARSILPPGAGSIRNFTARCTGCRLCVAHCTGEVLRPGREGGIELMYGNAMCEFDCNNCSQVCPSGAIRPLTLAIKQRTRIGMVAYAENLCIAAVDGTECGACAEHCPTGALTMVPGPRDARIPKPIPDLCIGCGNCQYACPVRPVRAVVVHPVSIQVLAADPAAYKKTPSADPVKKSGSWAF